MLWTHVTNQLSAYCQGEVSEHAAQQIDSHLKICSPCAARHEEIKRGIFLAGHLSHVPCPPSVSSDLEAILGARRESTLREPKATARLSSWKLVQAGLIFTGVVALLVGYLGFRPGPRHTQVSLDTFLKAIEAHPQDSSGAFSQPPPGFVDSDEPTTLAVAGLERMPGESPLKGYRLVYHRLKKTSGVDTVQLVYRNENDAFSVFVTPRPATFSFGNRDIKKAQVDGIACHKVDCPGTSTVWFGAGKFSCVLVTKSRRADELAAIIRYFTSAHQNRSQQ